jgi:ribosomal protein S18 acetylase RimI-like enzyme
VIRYRCFRNTDPPGLVEIWNDAFTGRGAYQLRSSASLERWAFAKPYFDPNGFFLAEDEGRAVGFAHAGFGPDDNLYHLSNRLGVVCAIGVMTTYRRQGIGTALLRHCEAYLTAAGSGEIVAGPMRPNNPFYFGLYGGSDSPGFLLSDAGAGPFFEHHGYHGRQTCLVLQRKLDGPVGVIDPRFAALKRRYEVQILPRPSVGTWWQECVLGQMEPVEFRLEDKQTGLPAARATIWEMEGFSWRWNYPAAGILDILVRPDLRRQGLARFLVAQLMRYLQDQYFGIAEVQTDQRNQAAVSLYLGLGFEQVDAGRTYQRGAESTPGR